MMKIREHRRRTGAGAFLTEAPRAGVLFVHKSIAFLNKDNLCKGDTHYEICKKALSVLLSVLMLLSFATVAFAEDGGATITVELEKQEVSFILNNIDLNSYPAALQAMITQKLIDD